MKKVLLALTLATFVCNLTLAPVSAQGGKASMSQAEKCLRLGKTLKEVGEIGQAENLLLTALEESHHSEFMPQILEELANLYIASDDMDKARNYLKRAISVEERFLGARNVKVAELEMKLAETYIGENNYKLSEWHLNNALSILMNNELMNNESKSSAQLKKVNLDIASCINDLAICVSHTGSQKELQTLLDRAGKIKANPEKKHFN